jgi:protein SCO1/2
MPARATHILLVVGSFLAGLVVFLAVFLYATGQFGGGNVSGSAIGGAFALTDQNGQPITDKDLRGKPFLVFFGYTHCPDVCPTTLFELAQVEPLLGPKAADVQTVFISVDPGRDTPAQVAAYVNNPAFPKHLVGLTGSPAQVDTAAKAYRVFYQKQGEGADYTLNHAAYSYLMTPKGRFACVLPYGQGPEKTAAKIQAAMAQGPNAERC